MSNEFHLVQRVYDLEQRLNSLELSIVFAGLPLCTCGASDREIHAEDCAQQRALPGAMTRAEIHGTAAVALEILEAATITETVTITEEMRRRALEAFQKHEHLGRAEAMQFALQAALWG